MTAILLEAAFAAGACLGAAVGWWAGRSEDSQEADFIRATEFLNNLREFK